MLILAIGATQPLKVLASEISVPGSSASKTLAVRIVTDGFTPLQYLKDGQPDGYVTEYIRATFEKVKARYPLEVSSFEFLPWKRALLVAKSSPNTLFFSLSRTPEREANYQWLGTVSPYRQSFFRLDSNRDVTASTLEELRDSTAMLGVQRGGAVQILLDQTGFQSHKDYTTYTHYSQGIKMLFAGRIDAIPLTDFLARNSACRTGFDGNRLTPVVAIEELAKPLWATLSNGSDPGLVLAVKEAMAELKKDGTFQEILDRHLKDWQNQPCAINPTQ